jgi:2-polyprenyl-3-methyl-5-hydroxy-6-metoxy-1,4-benzoquinol methylase
MTHCPICENGRSEYLFTKDARDYVRCKNCDLVYSLPRPTEATLSDLYDGIGSRYFTDPRMLAYYFEPHRFERELGFIEKYLPARSSLMDVGCCVGAFVYAAETHGYRVEGIDISVAAVSYGKGRGLNLRVEDILATDYQTPFDAVCLWSTLEHVANPLAFLQKTFQIIRPGGWFFTSVPNFSSLSQRVLGKKFNLVAVEHLNYFTPKVLTSAISSAGFEVRGIRSVGFNPINFLRDLKHGDTQAELEEQIDRAAVTLRVVSSPLRHAQRLTERALDLFGHFADVVMVAAQKPATFRAQ